MADNLYFIRFTCYDVNSKINVLYGALINKQKQTIERFDVIASNMHDLIITDNLNTFRDVNARVQKYILEGHSSHSFTSGLMNSYKNSYTSESYMIEFFHYLDHEEHEKLKNLLLQNVNRVLGRGDYATDIYAILTNMDEMEKLTPLIQINTGASSKGSSDIEVISHSVENTTEIIPPGSLVGKFNFVLSPVSGKSVVDLKLGDKILIKLLPEDDSSNNIINLLMLKEDNGIIRNAPATVASIRHNDRKEMEFIVKITDGVFAKYTEAETKIKVKMATNETLASLANNTEDKLLAESGGKKEEYTRLLIIAGVVLLVIIWIFVVFFVL